MISVGNLSTRASSKGRAEYTSKEQIEIVAFLVYQFFNYSFLV